MDYIGPFHKSGRDGAEYVLTMRDRFSGFTMLRRCRNANALDTVRGFVEQWVAIFGVPHRVITDQGAHFKGKEMRLLAHFFGIDHIRTTAYHPQTNGKVERVHQDIKAQLRKLCEESHDLWEDKLAAVQFTINNTKKETTGFSPSEIVFGWRPAVPYQHVMRNHREEDMNSYVFRMREYLARLRDLVAAEDKFQAESAMKKDLEGRRFHVANFYVGQLVWLKEQRKGIPRKAIGPCQIVWENPDGRGLSFKVRVAGPGPDRSVNASDLRPYLHPAFDALGYPHNTFCTGCGTGGGGRILQCRLCPSVWHAACAREGEGVSGVWVCKECKARQEAPVTKAKKMISKRKREEEIEAERGAIELADEEDPDEGAAAAKEGIELSIPAPARLKDEAGTAVPVRRSARLRDRRESGLMEVRRLVADLVENGGG
jgi:hypothetical protein